MTKLSLFLIGLIALSVTTVPVLADDDDDDEREFGFGEREREHGDEKEDDDDDERIGLGTGVSDMVLYVTISAIVGTIGYTGYKIISTKRPKLVKK